MLSRLTSRLLAPRRGYYEVNSPPCWQGGKISDGLVTYIRKYGLFHGHIHLKLSPDQQPNGPVSDHAMLGSLFGPTYYSISPSHLL